MLSVPGKQPVVAESPVQRRRVFFQDGLDALRHVVLDRLDDVDRPAQNQVAGFFVTGVVGPSGRRAVILQAAACGFATFG
jgi:hypothetical protein